MRLRNFRSVGGWVQVDFPAAGPLVLIGENNAGKSNLVHALDLVLGEYWPGNFQPEDHQCFGRDRSAMPMQIVIKVEDMVHIPRNGSPFPICEITWRYDPSEERPCAFDVWEASRRSHWPTTETRDQLPCVVVGADRRLGYQLSYTSKWTLLSKLMRRFHERLVADDERGARLRAQFDAVIGIFHEVAEFRAFEEGLRTMAGELAANMRYGLEMNFSAYDPSNYFRSLRVHPTSNGEVRTFEELGTGQEQILALAFAYAYARSYGEGDGGLILVIEEPEAHLHPLAQQWLSRKIHELSATGVQIVLTTHSPAFVDLAHVGGLACVRKPGEDAATTVVQRPPAALAEGCRNRGAARATAGNIAAFYAASSTEETTSGLFARACVVVEGQTEALALPVLLRAVGLDPLAEGIAVVNAGGIGAISRWLRLYGAFGIPAYAVFDSDSRDDPQGVKRADLLMTLSVSAGDYSALVQGVDELAIAARYAVFTPDFERVIRSLFPADYEALEEDARSRLGTGKPLVARSACAALSERTELPGWDMIRSLAQAIGAMTGQSASAVTT
jgi:putative ATP-dependent endonuclease of OLD family